MSNRIGHNSRGMLWLSRSYNNVDKDPECDRFRTMFQKERIKEDDLAVLAGLHKSTVKNMFGGKTIQPKHATFAKMAGAMGYEYTLQRSKRPDYEREVPKAQEQRKEYMDYLAKKKARQERRANGRSH